MLLARLLETKRVMPVPVARIGRGCPGRQHQTPHEAWWPEHDVWSKPNAGCPSPALSPNGAPRLLDIHKMRTWRLRCCLRWSPRARLRATPLLLSIQCRLCHLQHRAGVKAAECKSMPTANTCANACMLNKRSQVCLATAYRFWYKLEVRARAASEWGRRRRRRRHYRQTSPCEHTCTHTHTHTHSMSQAEQLRHRSNGRAPMPEKPNSSKYGKVRNVRVRTCRSDKGHMSPRQWVTRAQARCKTQ